MTKLIGRLESIGVGKESSRGTAVAPTYWIPWLDLKLDNKVNLIKNEASVGRLEDSDGSVVTGKYGEAEIMSKIKDKSFGLFLLSCLGTCTTDANADGSGLVYDHAFTVLQSSQHPTLTLAHKSANDDVAYANALVDSLKFGIKYGEYAYFTAKLMSKASASASNTVSHTAENDFVAQNVTFKKATTQSGLDAASAIKIRELSLEINNSAMFEYVLGSVAPNDVLNQGFNVKGNITLVHNDATFADMQNNETYNALRFDLVNSAVTIGTSANPRLKIDLNRVRISNYERKMKLNDLVEESFDFDAHYSLTDSKMLTITLTNLASSY